MPKFSGSELRFRKLQSIEQESPWQSSLQLKKAFGNPASISSTQLSPKQVGGAPKFPQPPGQNPSSTKARSLRVQK
jgi:hypothetical protein